MKELQQLLKIAHGFEKEYRAYAIFFHAESVEDTIQDAYIAFYQHVKKNGIIEHNDNNVKALMLFLIKHIIFLNRKGYQLDIYKDSKVVDKIKPTAKMEFVNIEHYKHLEDDSIHEEDERITRIRQIIENEKAKGDKNLFNALITDIYYNISGTHFDNLTIRRFSKESGIPYNTIFKSLKETRELILKEF